MSRGRIVLNVMLQNIGTLLAKDVLHANQVTLGTRSLTNAHALNCRGPSSELTVSARQQRSNWMLLLKPAHAHKILSVISVSHALLQESGTKEQTPVNAHLRKMFGIEPDEFVQLGKTGHHVLNAKPQDTGTFNQINVFARSHSFGGRPVAVLLTLVTSHNKVRKVL